MAVTLEQVDRLSEPFPAHDVEWRVGSAGKKKNGDIWAKCFAYINSRAIMERLDEVCGRDNWRNEVKPLGDDRGVLSGIGILVARPDGTTEWVTKWDGSEYTDFEATKGGISGALKRAGVQWGIGRYLYYLDEGWATIHDNGANYSPESKNAPSFNWDPPALPAWALPGGSGVPDEKRHLDLIAFITREARNLPEDALCTWEGESVKAKQFIRSRWAMVTGSLPEAEKIAAVVRKAATTTPLPT